ncbi:5'-3' exoribonuclease 1 [Hetaerina americana]|uniref:5'-3' exoribonuclease 1 n=1 Tax=Hetaerina americana TaxID=62018 RepID=UPI003A7F434D
MGVPKFFRWLYERYPCLCELIREYEIPEFDNLYLDMNGIIHMCSHPNDFDPNFRITDEQIFKSIFHYIEILFRMIQPQKLFFMAVDGVAPRAKLNQQRGRRFRTAKEAATLEKKAVESGLELPEGKRFDSNCITPGTEFMERLHHQLRYFIADKMTNDKLWKNVKVILSGHETPGEGEHKIMDYIRYMKAQPDYDHNTRHCLYGLDADLIMLGLCTHEPHFSLLREEVKYGKRSNRITMPEDTKYYLLHLSLLRGYLDWEFASLKDKLPFGYNLENIIDDWVLMGFLVGNDFIPNLPGLHIAHGALQMLHKAYMDVLPTLDGYLNEGGTLVLSRFQRYLEKLAAFDIHQFKNEFADLKYFAAKTGRRMGSNRERPKFFNVPGEVMGSNETRVVADPKLQEMLLHMEKLEKELEEMSLSKENEEEYLKQLFGGIEDDFHEEDSDEDDEHECTAMFLEFCQMKRDYYTNKLEFEKVTPEVLQSQAEGYVYAIQWNLHYYYNGVCSWSWFYPHHYAPYISDIKNFCNVNIKFDMGKPFLPFQQLLAVLPSLSKELLPAPYHTLMEDENSPIIHYFPTTFQTDLNGKRQDWEAVVLIPFIDEVELQKAMDPLEGMLTEEEKRRNKHGPMLVYTYSGKSVGSFETQYFPKIESNHALEKRMTQDEIYVPQENLVKGLCSNVFLDVYIPGFPFLKYVPHKAYLEKAKVRVFDSPSHGESMILDVLTDEIIHWKKDTSVIAKELLGRTYQVSWPHLFETKIIEVIDSKSTYSLVSLPTSKAKQECDSEESKGKQTLNIQPTSQERWRLDVQGIKEEYGMHKGIKLGPVNVVVRALPMSGRKYAFKPKGTVNLEKQWSNVPMSFALQTVVKDIKVREPEYLNCTTIHEMFPPKTVVFLLGNPHYGSMSKVVDIVPSTAGKVARVKIAVNVVPEPDMEAIKAQVVHSGTKYYPGGVAAKRLGIGGHLLSRMMGTMYVMQYKMQPYSKAANIGLNLKFNKRNEEVPGFTKKDNNNTWLYSDKSIELLSEYIKTFPDLFSYLSEHTETNEFQEAVIFPEGTREGCGLKDVVEWLSQQAHTKVEHRKCGAQVLEDDIVQAIEKQIEGISELVKKGRKTLTFMVQPHLIHKPGFKMGYMQPDEDAKYMLCDRVVNVRECFTVPLGLRGTVVGIQRASRQENTLYDIMFDSGFEGGGSLAGCSPGKGYRLPGYSLVNLSHGARCSKAGNMDVVMSQTATKNSPLSGNRVLLSGNSSVSYSNHANSSAFLGGHRALAGVPDRPASAFASWRVGCTGFGPGCTPSAPAPPPANNGSQRSPNQHPSRAPPPKIDSAFKGKDPVLLLRRPTLAQAPPPAAPAPLPPAPAGPASSSCSVEFQAMWKELQKCSGSAKSEDGVKSSSTFPMAINANQQLPATDPFISNQESCTDYLKKILRIDEKSSTTSQTNVFPSSSAVPAQNPVTSPLQDKNQSSVQDFFEKAKAVTAQQQEKNQKGPVNYCLQLISMYQRTGQGIPRYDYVMMENGLVIANVSLPNGAILQGEPAPTNEKASENVAKLAIGQMSKWMKGDMPFGGVPMPANKLPAPPRQWYQSPMPPHHQQPFNPFSNQHNWQGANIYQKLNWREHPDQSADWRRKQNQWQNIRPPPPSQPVFGSHKFVPSHPLSYNPFQQPQQPNLPQPPFAAHMWRQPPVPTIGSTHRPVIDHAAVPTNGAMTSSSNPFIPLQAVRAQMSANSSTGSHVSPQAKGSKQSPRRHQPPPAPMANMTPEVPLVPNASEADGPPGKGKGGSGVKDSEKKLDGGAPQSRGDEKGQQKAPTVKEGSGRKEREGKALYVPPHARKSRLAIKFGSDE